MLLVEPRLQPLRLRLHALNGEQVVVAVWQFVGNLKYQNCFIIEHSPKKINKIVSNIILVFLLIKVLKSLPAAVVTYTVGWAAAAAAAA